MVIGFKDIITLIQALFWPVVVVVALIIFRDPLSRFLRGMGQRATKLSAFQFTVELAAVPEFAPTWSVLNSDVRQLTSANVFDSASQTLFAQFASEVGFDYAVVDLGTGQEWLTSRLFIFAIMLQRMRGLKCFVFLETDGSVRKRFLGVATPDSIHWSLAMTFPWLEQAFAKSYAQISPQIRSVQGALETWVATNLVRDFITEIQSVQPPDATVENEWVAFTPKNQLPPQQLWEHGQWLSAADVEQILGGLLQASQVQASPDFPLSRRTQAILRCEGAFTALTEDRGRFKQLIDRYSLLEQVAAYLEENFDDSS
jgi:hypothetical protein